MHLTVNLSAKPPEVENDSKSDYAFFVGMPKLNADTQILMMMVMTTMAMMVTDGGE